MIERRASTSEVGGSKPPSVANKRAQGQVQDHVEEVHDQVLARRLKE